MSASPSEAARRLAEAAGALAQFRDAAGLPAPEGAASTAWRLPADASVRAALDEADARAADLENALGEATRAHDALREENLRLSEELKDAGALAAAAEELRARAADADSRAAEQKARATLMEAEYVRLEAMRRKAERAAADAEASGRLVEETLRRELRAANAALDRAASESGALEARVKGENETLRQRLDSVAARLQTLERERRLELARASGDAQAAQAELQRAQAVAAALRQQVVEAESKEDAARRELTSKERELEAARAELEAARGSGAVASAYAQLESARAEVAALRRQLAESEQRESALRRAPIEAERREDDQRRDLTAMSRALEDVRAALSASGAEIERGKKETAAAAAELERSQAVVAALRRELAAADQAPRSLAAGAPALSEPPPPAGSEVEEDLEPVFETVALPNFVQPPVEAVLDPGWSRLLRLVRPPVEAAYAQLRRLSSTALTSGQKALLRMAAASIAQATDSLSSVELALEEGPAPAAAAPVLPALEAGVASWEAAFRRQGVALAREWSATLPEAAHEAKALRVMLNHVLRNVLEAVPRGGRLTVKGARGPDGGLRVEFSDDGPGFSKEWLERRFEPFASPRPGRAGLGLSLVRRTLRRWGGDAEAANGPGGRGARLTLMFPPPAPRKAP